MPQRIINFEDYATLLTKKLRALRHFERCIFSAWCAEYLLRTRGASVQRELGESALQELRDILAAIWQCLLAGTIPTKDLLNALDCRFMQINADDMRMTAGYAHLVATSVLSVVGICILGCRRNNVELARRCAGEIVSVLSYELVDTVPHGTSASDFEKVFTSPEMDVELQMQLKMIRHLRGECELGESVRAMFRE